MLTIFPFLVAIPIIKIIIVLAIIGGLLYVVNRVIPMPAWMRTVINVIVAIVVILWLLNVFGVGNMTLNV